MIIDASAFVAVLLNEPGSYDLFEQVMYSDTKKTIPSAVWEACVSIANRLQIPVSDVSGNLERFLTDLSIEVVAIPAAVGFLSVDAYERFGKGRHPAALNFGDCIIYATSKLLNLPLLFKGDDFSKTDIQVA